MPPRCMIGDFPPQHPYDPVTQGVVQQRRAHAIDPVAPVPGAQPESALAPQAAPVEGNYTEQNRRPSDVRNDDGPPTITGEAGGGGR